MGFEYDLSSKRRFFLYMYQICPLLDIIRKIYNMKLMIENDETIQWYIDVFPYKQTTIHFFMDWFIREHYIYSNISLPKSREELFNIFQKMVAIMN